MFIDSTFTRLVCVVAHSPQKARLSTKQNGVIFVYLPVFLQNILIRVNTEALSTHPWTATTSTPRRASIDPRCCCPSPPLSHPPFSDEGDTPFRHPGEVSIDHLVELWQPGAPCPPCIPKVSPVAASTDFLLRQHFVSSPYTAIVGDLGVCLDLRQ